MMRSREKDLRTRDVCKKDGRAYISLAVFCLYWGVRGSAGSPPSQKGVS